MEQNALVVFAFFQVGGGKQSLSETT